MNVSALNLLLFAHSFLHKEERKLPGVTERLPVEGESRRPALGRSLVTRICPAAVFDCWLLMSTEPM